MSKITPIPYRKLIQVFERFGFRVARQRGDHIIMRKPGIFRPLVIKTSPGEVPVAHIRTNLTTAGISHEEYFAALEAL